jgi:hypothetical protein
MAAVHPGALATGALQKEEEEEEGMLRIFTLVKNPTASAGFEPANSGTRGQHANH